MNVPTVSTGPTAASVVQTDPTVSAPPAAPAPGERRSTADRIADMKARLEAEPAEQAASDEDGSGGGPATSSSSEPEVPKVAPSEPSAAAKAAADRQARIQAVRAKETAAEEKRQRERQGKVKEGELEQLRMKLSKLEPLEQVWKSPAALLEAAEKQGLSASQLVAEMRTRLSDPDAIAKRAAQTAEEKANAELAKVREEMQQLRDDLARKDREAQEQTTSVQKAHAFVGMVNEKATEHPHTARLLKQRGPEALIRFANTAIVPHLHEGYTLDHLHDQIEHFLEFVSGEANAPHAPAESGASQPKKPDAAKSVTTLSNSVASERHSMVEDVPLHRLPKKDRLERLKAKLDRE